MSSARDSTVFGRTRAPDHDWLAKAAAEPVLDPRVPIVDPHVHFWHHQSGYRYFVEEFARDVAGSGHAVEATVFVECGAMYRADGPDHLKPVGETEFAVGMAAIGASQTYSACRTAAGIVGRADLTLGDRTRETLEAHVAAANGRFRGVRQTAKWDADPVVRGAVSIDRPGLLLEPDFGRGLDLLTSMGLSFDVSLYHPQIAELTKLARAHPGASLIMIHTGSPLGYGGYGGRGDEVHAAWLAAVRELATCPNVTVKLGGLLMCLGNFDFTTAAAPPTSEELAALWRPYIEPCLEFFGAGRCMASSNFPVDKAGFGYGTLWNMYKRLLAGCSAEEKALVLGGTAKRVYRL